MKPRSQRPPRRPSDRPAPRTNPPRGGLPRVELVSVGRELLRGRVQDTNGSVLARALCERGAVITRITVVDDRERAVSDAVREALERNVNLVVVSGGLGPSDEDRTLAGVGNALGLPLARNEEAHGLVDRALHRLHRRKAVADTARTAAREKLALVPVGGTAVENAVGVSPGVICRLAGGATVLCLPGAPEETKSVFEAAMAELRFEARGQVALREIESPTPDESALYPLLDRLADEFPDIWINCRPGGPRGSGARVVVSLEASGADEVEANSTVDRVVKRLLALAAGSP